MAATSFSASLPFSSSVSPPPMMGFLLFILLFAFAVPMADSSTLGVKYMSRLLEIQDRERAPSSVQRSAAYAAVNRKDSCDGESCFKLNNHPGHKWNYWGGAFVWSSLVPEILVWSTYILGQNRWCTTLFDTKIWIFPPYSRCWDNNEEAHSLELLSECCFLELVSICCWHLLVKKPSGRKFFRWCCTYLLDATDPLFVEIGRAFIRQQLKEYGRTSHIYNCDTFDENTPPVDDPEYIAALAAAIFEGMESGDVDAVWLMQGWLFTDDPFWKPPQMKVKSAFHNANVILLKALFSTFCSCWKVGCSRSVRRS